MAEVDILLDPSFSFPDASDEQLIQALGLIPQFIFNGQGETLKDRLENAYQFFGSWAAQNDDWYVDDNGKFHFPDDPVLEPFAKYEGFGEVAYQYKYGLIAVCDEEGEWVYSRFD